MFNLAVKIWLKGVVAFTILCALLAIPSLGIALLGLAFGLLISLSAIPLYAFVIYILKRSEASEGNAVFFLFLATVPAVILSLWLGNFFNGEFINFKAVEFYSHPAFWVTWLCAAISFPFAEKQIRVFFDDTEPIFIQ